MKKLVPSALLFLLVYCSQENNKQVYVEFTKCKELNNIGFISDSTINYFPEKLFTDTVSCYITPSGQICDPKLFGKKEQILIHGGTLEELRDTFKIETDTSYFRKTSYMLFKMKEPVLSDRFLGRNIYRIIGLRSFHEPIVIRIENDKGKVTIVSKKLNRYITYPFLKLLDTVVMFEPPKINGAKDKIDFKKQYEIAKRENDSLCNLYNNTNYYLLLNEKKEVMPPVWDSLEILIESSKFWKTKPELYLNHYQIDGSMWYIEGHFKSGYQIKRIPNPHFSKLKYQHNYDKNDYYAHIFRFLIENSELKNEVLY